MLTFYEKLVSKYCNISFLEVAELDYDVFLFFAKEGYVYSLLQTESGREYLEKCWILQQTEPDRNALRKILRKEKNDA